MIVQTTGARRACRAALFLAALALPVAASAQVAVTTQAVNVRAGPDRAFPLVTWLPAGTAVNVVGCIDGWRWCDVVAGRDRGFVYSRFLSYTFGNQPVVILHGGPTLGLPLVTFSIGPYWDTWYRNRPWWNNRNYWYSRPPPPPVAWRPPPPRPPPPVVRPPRPSPPTTRPPRPGPPPGSGPPDFGPPPAGSRPSRPGSPPSGSRPPDSRPPSGGSRPPGAPSNRPPPGSRSP
jgi:uncharacterized protein YraI